MLPGRSWLGGWALLQLLIPYFYYLPALRSPESSRGYGNWPVWPGERGDGGESNRPATNLPLGSVESGEVYRMVKKSWLGVNTADQI